MEKSRVFIHVLYYHSRIFINTLLISITRINKMKLFIMHDRMSCHSL